MFLVTPVFEMRRLLKDTDKFILEMFLNCEFATKDNSVTLVVSVIRTKLDKISLSYHRCNRDTEICVFHSSYSRRADAN